MSKNKVKLSVISLLCGCSIGCVSEVAVDPGIDVVGLGNNREKALRVKHAVDEAKLNLSHDNIDYLGINSSK